MKVLITGDKGYIGSHLAPMFPGYQSCDLKDDKDYRYAFRDEYWDVLIHLAASVSVTESFLKPFEYWDNNALGLGKFFATNYAKRVIFVSTGGAMYGNNLGAKEEEAEYRLCLSPYAQSKFIAEQIVREEREDNHCILRLANVYGGNHSIRGEAAVHSHFERDNPIVVYGGNQTRDFIHIDDVCKAIHRAATSDVVDTFNIGSGVETPIIDVATDYSTQRGVPVSFQPARPGEVQHISLDITEAKEAGLLI